MRKFGISKKDAFLLSLAGGVGFLGNLTANFLWLAFESECLRIVFGLIATILLIIFLYSSLKHIKY